jgi:hypothetical protein
MIGKGQWDISAGDFPDANINMTISRTDPRTPRAAENATVDIEKRLANP